MHDHRSFCRNWDPLFKDSLLFVQYLHNMELLGIFQDKFQSNGFGMSCNWECFLGNVFEKDMVIVFDSFAVTEGRPSLIFVR